MDLTALIPPKIQPMLLELSRYRDWLSMKTLEQDGHPRTELSIDYDRLPPSHTAAGRAIRVMASSGSGMIGVALMEANSRLLGDGPKLFRPSAEQFSSMEHVEMRMPVREFRSPYHCLAIAIPNECRHELADRVGVPRARSPQIVSVARWESNHVLVTIPIPGSGFEEHYQFGEHPLNHTIESVLNRWIKDGTPVGFDEFTWEEKGIKTLGLHVARAALNLCMMLTHFGYHVTGPVDPVAWKKHRRDKKLERFKHADFEAVELKQNIVVRNVAYLPTANPPGLGVGTEVKPHWRKGHWRAYPGCGAARAAGEQVPLLFVRPCLVRSDRVVGDLGDTEATYHS